MKKIIYAILAFGFISSNAQITLVPDVSFGNNGELHLDQNVTKFLSYHFIGNKLMVQNLDFSNPNVSGSRITMLNDNGSYDSNFGLSNGSFFINNLSDFVHYSDGNHLLFFSGKKYLANGSLDTSYAGNGETGNYSNESYRKVLPNGKLLVRNEDHFHQFLQSGNLDQNFGNNGVVNAYNSSFSGSLISDFKTNTSFFHVLNDDTVLEYNFNHSFLRKVNISTGNYDLLYGVNGNGQFFNGNNAGIMKFIVQNNQSSINYLFDYNSNIKYITKTLATGLLDTSFGISGKIDLPETISGYNVLYNQDFTVYNQTNFIVPVVYSNQIYLVNFTTNGLGSINSQSLLDTGITTGMTNPDDKIFISVHRNYLYLFITPNIIKRYTISENGTLSNSDVSKIKNNLNFNNPFKDEFILQNDEDVKFVEFYDESGRLVLKSIDGNKINTSNLKKGVYFIKITTKSNQVISKKGIKN